MVRNNLLIYNSLMHVECEKWGDRTLKEQCIARTLPGDKST